MNSNINIDKFQFKFYETEPCFVPQRLMGEISQKIFPFLPFTSQVSLLLTCKDWKNAFHAYYALRNVEEIAKRIDQLMKEGCLNAAYHLASQLNTEQFHLICDKIAQLVIPKGIKNLILMLKINSQSRRCVSCPRLKAPNSLFFKQAFLANGPESQQKFKQWIESLDISSDLSNHKQLIHIIISEIIQANEIETAQELITLVSQKSSELLECSLSQNEIARSFLEVKIWDKAVAYALQFSLNYRQLKTEEMLIVEFLKAAMEVSKEVKNCLPLLQIAGIFANLSSVHIQEFFKNYFKFNVKGHEESLPYLFVILKYIQSLDLYEDQIHYWKLVDNVLTSEVNQRDRLQTALENLVFDVMKFKLFELSTIFQESKNLQGDEIEINNNKAENIWENYEKLKKNFSYSLENLIQLKKWEFARTLLEFDVEIPENELDRWEEKIDQEEAQFVSLQEFEKQQNVSLSSIEEKNIEYAILCSIKDYEAQQKAIKRSAEEISSEQVTPSKKTCLKNEEYYLDENDFWQENNIEDSDESDRDNSDSSDET